MKKWHSEFNLDDLKKAVNSWNKHPNLYFLAQPPIFHITSNNLSEAIKLRNLGESAGFKYSSIRSIKLLQNNAKIDLNHGAKSSDDAGSKYGKITVELLSTERLNIPLGYKSVLIVNNEYLNHITKIANDVLVTSRDKLNRLEKILRDNLK